MTWSCSPITRSRATNYRTRKNETRTDCAQQQQHRYSFIDNETMVGTRSSPTKSRANNKRAPALPTQKDKKGGRGRAKSAKGGSQKAPGKVTAAAKKAVVDEAGKTFVKAEPTDFKGTGKFTDEEDEYLCKAYVSCSTDPILGAEQKGEKFWKAVHEKTYLLYNEEAEVAIQSKRPWDSLRNRFQKTIQPRVQKFNAYYKQAVQQNESGWTKEMYIEAAKKIWETMEGRPYNHGVCTRILHQMPKFNPMIEDDEEDDGKPAANPVGQVMGDKMERPMGTKQAKKQKLMERLDADTVASSQAMDAMARSSADMTKIMARRQKHDSLAKRADLYLKMGQEDKALEMMAKMEEDDVNPILVEAPSPATVPKTIDVAAAAAAQTESKEQDEDESTHSSQPSDDSRLVKKVPI